jgi:hypothetical protein
VAVIGGVHGVHAGANDAPNSAAKQHSEKTRRRAWYRADRCLPLPRATTVCFLELVQVSRRSASSESAQPCERGTRARPHPPEPGDAMSDLDHSNEPVPLMQQLLDNPFLLLFIGVMVPMIVYTLWGVIDILTVPLTK